MPRRAFAVLLFLVAVPLLVGAADISVTATVEGTTPPTPADTVVIFRGIAYPNSPVSIHRGSTLLATVPADPTARFDVSLGNQTPGTFTYTVSSEDARGLASLPMNFTLTLTTGATITITGVFLGPTLKVNKPQVELGETLTFLGATAPQSQISIVVSSAKVKTFAATADASGLWTKQVLSTDLGVGSHSAKAKAVAPTSEISSFSGSVAFSVVAQPTVDVCAAKKAGDINCDGKVNLTDFSILLFYWKQTRPANARADVNGDHIVNLTDLSIMLFNWSL